MVTRVDTHGKRHQAIHFRSVCFISVVQVRESGMVSHTSHPITQEAEVGRSWWVRGQARLCCLKTTKPHSGWLRQDSYCSYKTRWPKATWGDMFDCSLLLPGHTPLQREGRAGYSRQELKQKSWRNSVCWLVPLAQPIFLMPPPRNHMQVAPKAPSTISWTLPNQSLIKNTPHRLSYRPILWRYFLIVIPS